jgi:hypothetical protein
MRRMIVLSLLSALVLAGSDPALPSPRDPACDDTGCTTNYPTLEPESFEFGPEEWELAPGSLSALTDVRCKRQTFKASFKQVGLVTVIRYEGEFRVCYRPGVEIVSWSSLHGDATYTVVPWEWRGNDPDYPYGTKITTETIQFHYRGSAAVCLFSKGCGPTKHAWVRVTFHADNTLSKVWGVA